MTRAERRNAIILVILAIVLWTGVAFLFAKITAGY